MPDIVVDASVLSALIFREPRAQEAAALIQQSGLYAPRLLAYEIVNVAQKKVLRNQTDPATALQDLASGFALDIRLVEPDYTAVLALALETGLTTYDAAYLQVARALGAELVTFDERLRTVARRLLP